MNTIVKKTNDSSDSFFAFLVKCCYRIALKRKKLKGYTEKSIFTSVLLIEIKTERIYNTSD